MVGKMTQAGAVAVMAIEVQVGGARCTSIRTMAVPCLEPLKANFFFNV